MRLIDADALEKEGWSLHRTIRVDKNTEEYQTKPLKQIPTIEERKTGRWIRWEETIESESCMKYIPHCKCSECGTEYDPYASRFVKYCMDCGAKMEVEHD